MVLGDIVVLGVLGVTVGAIVGKMLRDRKKGKTCCGSCTGCALAGSTCSSCGGKK